MKIQWGWGSALAAGYVVVGFLMAFVTAARSDPRLAGVDPRTWVVAAGVLAAILVVGRMVQRARGVQRPVAWGPASVIGYAGALAAALAPFVEELADVASGVGGRTWVGLSALLAAAATAGRMDQGSRLDPGTLESPAANPGDEVV